MLKPIIEKNLISFKNLFLFILNNLQSIIKFPLVCLMLFIFYFLLLKSPSYTATVTFYTNYVNKTESSILNPLLQNFSSQSSNLNFSIANYINSDKFLDDIVSNQYSINEENKNLIDHWGKEYNKFFSINPISLLSNINYLVMLNQDLSVTQKKKDFAKIYLRNSIVYSEERLSNLHTITIRLRNDSMLAKQIAENAYYSIVNFSSEVTNVKATEKRKFIEGRLSEVRNDLEVAENNLVVFLNENKNLGSPNLLVKRNRIEREISLFTQLYLSLSDQLELAKIDEQDNTSSIFLLDSPHIDSNKSGMTLLYGSFMVLAIFFTISLAWHLMKHRKELFIQ